MKATSSDKLANKDCFYKVILHIIPVIDLLNGVCVHAKQGLRAQYQPIHSSLTHSSQPLDIVKAFMAIHPFKTLYIADLNAIQSTNELGQTHAAILTEIKQQFPQLELWVDAGTSTIQKTTYFQSLGVQIVLGSESFPAMTSYQTLQKHLDSNYILSLDFLREGYRGPTSLLTDTTAWPKKVIAMTLSQVGTNAGVDNSAIHQLLERSTGQEIYAAGGIRHIDDLRTLNTEGVKGALIASALHHQALTSSDLEALTA